MMVIVTLVGCDLEKGPQVYKVDPMGHCVGYFAVAAGAKDQEATTQLEKQYKKVNGEWNEKQALECAIKVLQACSNTDFKANEIEIGIATVKNPRFRTLKEAEIDRVLQEMQDAL